MIAGCSTVGGRERHTISSSNYCIAPLPEPLRVFLCLISQPTLEVWQQHLGKHDATSSIVDYAIDYPPPKRGTFMPCFRILLVLY